MKTGWIRVRVQPGMFPSEKSVSFEVGGQSYTAIVDQSDVSNNALKAYVIEQTNEEAVIDLPRDTFTSGNRLRVPADFVLPAA